MQLAHLFDCQELRFVHQELGLVDDKEHTASQQRATTTNQTQTVTATTTTTEDKDSTGSGNTFTGAFQMTISGTSTTVDSLHLVRRGGTVCMAGSLSGWLLPDFEPIAMIPSGTSHKYL